MPSVALAPAQRRSVPVAVTPPAVEVRAPVVPPTVHVSIGRIVVEAAAPKPATPRPASPTRPAAKSLAEILAVKKARS